VAICNPHGVDHPRISLVPLPRLVDRRRNRRWRTGCDLRQSVARKRFQVVLPEQCTPPID
jgi:hypothetical protein